MQLRRFFFKHFTYNFLLQIFTFSKRDNTQLATADVTLGALVAQWLALLTSNLEEPGLKPG
jgi:hypothetical protein